MQKPISNEIVEATLHHKVYPESSSPTLEEKKWQHLMSCRDRGSHRPRRISMASLWFKVPQAAMILQWHEVGVVRTSTTTLTPDINCEPRVYRKRLKLVLCTMVRKWYRETQAVLNPDMLITQRKFACILLDCNQRFLKVKNRIACR